MPDLERDLARSLQTTIERTLLGEARRNELRIAYARVVGTGLSTGLLTWFFVEPRRVGADSFPGAVVAIASLWFAGSALLAFALARGWYRQGLRMAIPIADAAFIIGLFVVSVHSMGHYAPAGFPRLMAATAALCAGFAVTGALRLTVASALTTTLLAVGAFAIAAAIVSYRPLEIAFVGALVLTSGLFGVWVTQVVRRAMEGEATGVILRRFLPPHLVAAGHEAALRSIIQPRSVEATVLVSDMRAFTRYAENRSPGEVLAFLNQLQGTLAAVVRAHGGTVDKFLGDGMLAVFGAPEPQTDHADRAVRAAVAMRSAAGAIRADVDAVTIGIGIHSGLVVAGCLGSGERLEFTVIGDTVNVASRLQGLTRERGVDILLSEDCVRRADRAAAEYGFEPAGEVAVRGRQAPLSLHALRKSLQPIARTADRLT